MLGEIFQQILDMSLIGCYSIIIVMVVRLLLTKCERKYIYYLWFVVFLNLCIPFSFQGAFSLIPSSVAEFSLTNVVENALGDQEAGTNVHGVGDQGGADDMTMTQQPGVIWSEADAEWNEMEAALDGTDANPVTPEENIDNGSYLSKTPTEAALPLPMRIASGIWMAGIGVLLLWSLIGTIRLKKQVSRDNWIRISRKKGIVEVADLEAPFLWGIFKPMIYLPTDLEAEELRYVVAHEQYHKKRKDHLVKIVVFFVVAIHWFNPLVWAAYFLFCKDMEISCDEAVLLQFKGNIKKQYAGSLLKYAAKQSGFVLSPITFGEPAVKSRIRNVLRFKKRGIVLSVLTVLCVFSVAAGLVLRPSAETVGHELDTDEQDSDTQDTDNQSDFFEDGNDHSNGNPGEESGVLTYSSEESFKSILLKNENFVCADMQNREVNLAGIKAVVTDEEGITVSVDKFTVIDLDGDGENEVVLWILVNGVSDYGFEILHYQEGTVYGNTLSYRAFYDLKVDGTFRWSGGAANSGVGRLTFAEDGRAVREELVDDVDSWNHEGQADVTWYDMSADGVNRAFERLSYSGYSSGEGETNAESWFGSYVITDYVIAGVTAMGPDEAENWINYSVEYGPNGFNSNGVLLEDPVYNERLVGKEEFETGWVGSGGGYYFTTLGIEGDSVLEVTIDNSDEFGRFFYVLDDGKILIHHPDGVFFIAERR